MTSQARKEYQRDWERAHAAGRGRSRKEWLAANPDKAAAYNARTRAWTAENAGVVEGDRAAAHDPTVRLAAQAGYDWPVPKVTPGRDKTLQSADI